MTDPTNAPKPANGAEESAETVSKAASTPKESEPQTPEPEPAQPEQPSEPTPPSKPAQAPEPATPAPDNSDEETQPVPSEVEEPTQLPAQPTTPKRPSDEEAAEAQADSTPAETSVSTSEVELDPEKTVVQPVDSTSTPEPTTPEPTTPPPAPSMGQPPTYQQATQQQPAVTQPTAQQPVVTPQQPTSPAPTQQAATPKSRTGLVVGAIIGVIVVLGCGVGGWLLYQNMAEERDHKVGKCIKQVNDERAKPVSCDDDGAYKIFKRVNDTTNEGKCPSGETDLVFINESDKYVLCLKKAN